MTFKTSQNMTIVGIAAIIGALAAAAAALFDGNPATNPDWMALFAVVVAGVTGILGKGAKSTGGTVDGQGSPIIDPAPPVLTTPGKPTP
jgi:hypothetical protein